MTADFEQKQEISHYEGPPLRHLPHTFAQRLSNALGEMPDDERARLAVERLNGWRLGRRNRAYDYNGGFDGAFFKVKGDFYQVLVSGPIDNRTRRSIGKKLGFNPRRARALLFEHNLDEHSGYALQQRLYVPK